jgi:crossover junction endodeoxyribonuclease RuvC
MITFVGEKVNMEKIILGIDPGTNLMGYGLLKVWLPPLSPTDSPPPARGQKVQMITMGVIDLRKFADGYLKLGHIFERVTGIIDGYLPDEMAIEAPFFGKNVQSMLKLGRAQGTAIAAAIHHGVPIHEYAPMKIKMALTGNGGASKEQVAGMLQRLLKIPNEEMGKFMDATDALAAAYCHYMQMGRPESDVKYRGWKDFVNKNTERVNRHGLTRMTTDKTIRKDPCQSDAKNRSDDEDD